MMAAQEWNSGCHHAHGGGLFLVLLEWLFLEEILSPVCIPQITFLQKRFQKKTKQNKSVKLGLFITSERNYKDNKVSYRNASSGKTTGSWTSESISTAVSCHLFEFSLRGLRFPPHPKDVQVTSTGMFTSSQSEWIWGWCVCAQQWKGILPKEGAHLMPWAARIGSSHPWPWTVVMKLENADFACFY